MDPNGYYKKKAQYHVQYKQNQTEAVDFMKKHAFVLYEVASRFPHEALEAPQATPHEPPVRPIGSSTARGRFLSHTNGLVDLSDPLRCPRVTWTRIVDLRRSLMVSTLVTRNTAMGAGIALALVFRDWCH